jgi:hypothetical protein
MSRWLQKPPLGTQIDWSNPLTQGLVGCWLFNEGSGNRVYDTSQAFPGYYGDIVGRDAGFWNLGDKADFGTGDGQYVKVGYWPNYPVFSVVMKVTLPDVAGNTYLFHASDSWVSNYAFHIYQGAAEEIFFLAKVGGSSKTIQTPALTIGKEYIITCLADGTNIGIYYNTSTVTPVAAGPIDGYSRNCAIGARAYNSFGGFDYIWPGKMDFLYLFNRAISRAEHNNILVNPYQILTSPRRMWLRPSGFVTVLGTIAATAANVTSSESGKVKVSGTEAATLAAVTAAETGTVKIAGSLAATLAQLVSAETGGVKVAGTLAAALSQLTAAEVGKVNISSTIAALLSQLTSADTGRVAISGHVTANLLAVTAALVGLNEGYLAINGSMSATLPIVAALNNGVVKISGGIVATDAAVVASLVGTSGSTNYKLFYIMKL